MTGIIKIKIMSERYSIDIDSRFSEYVYSRMVHLGRIGATIVLLLIPVFTILDLFVFKIPRQFIFFRIPPFVFAIVLAVIIKTVHVKNHLLVRVVYMLLLLSSLIMMNGIVMITAGSEYYDAAMLWLVIVIFLVFLGYRGGVKALALMLLVPLALLTVHLVLNEDLSVAKAGFLAMPYVVSIICVALAVSQNRMRYKRFQQAEIIETQTRELENNYRYIEQKNTQIFNDLRLARSVQVNLIPQDPPVMEGVGLYAAFIPLAELGGDYYDFIQFNEPDRVGVFISDVSGHGVAAALVSSMVKTLVHTAGHEKTSCGEFLAWVNERIIGLTKENFITAFYGIFDTGTRVLRYARGGHPYPYLIRTNGTIEELRSDGVLLGVKHGLTFEEREVELRQGDRVLFYTDGLMEARNFRHEEFEKTLINDIILRQRKMPMDSLIQSIIQGLFDFCGTSAINDDVCIILMEAR